MVALLIFGPQLFVIVFGENWEMAGVFGSILAIYLFTQFLQTPSSYVFYIFERQQLLLYLSAQRLLIVFSVFLAAIILNWAAVTSVLVYAVFLSLHYGLTILLAIKTIKNDK